MRRRNSANGYPNGREQACDSRFQFFFFCQEPHMSVRLFLFHSAPAPASVNHFHTPVFVPDQYENLTACIRRTYRVLQSEFVLVIWSCGIFALILVYRYAQKSEKSTYHVTCYPLLPTRLDNQPLSSSKRTFSRANSGVRTQLHLK